MFRLKDVYYTTQNLDGTPEVPAKAVPLDFYQGEDIILDIYLNYGDEAITTDNWEIKGVVKKTKYATNTLWSATLDNGLYKKDVQGYYRFLISAEATALFVPGTYWLTITVAAINGNDIKDLTLVLVNQPFSINASAASPYSVKQLDSTHTERTYPPAFDGKGF